MPTATMSHVHVRSPHVPRPRPRLCTWPGPHTTNTHTDNMPVRDRDETATNPTNSTNTTNIANISPTKKAKKAKRVHYMWSDGEEVVN
eukprot:883308-Prymnesium_polylepis.1